jgi:hypothetical protein
MTSRFAWPLAVLVVWSVSVGCGGRVDEAAQGSVDGGGADASSVEPVVYRAGYDGLSVVVIAMHPDTGAVAQFGPVLPLPLLAGQGYGLDVSTLADGRLVVGASGYTSSTKPGAATPKSAALVGDGTGWKVVASDSCSLTALASPGGTLIRAAHTCGEGDSATEVDEIVTPDGASLWKSAQPWDLLIGMAPDDSYGIVRSNGGLDIWTLAGGEASLTTASLAIDATFATSMLVGIGTQETWLDPHGAPVAVASFDADPSTLAAPRPSDTATSDGLFPFFPDSVQVAGGKLWSLSDRALAPLQTLPSWVTAGAIAAVLPRHYAIASRPNGIALVIVAPDGTAAPLYGDPDAAPPVAPYTDIVDVAAQSFTAPRPWVLVEEYRVPTPNAGLAGQRVIDTLIFPGDPATGVLPESHQLLDITGGDGRIYFPSATGRHVMYLGSGQLRSVDVTTLADLAAPAKYILE